MHYAFNLVGGWAGFLGGAVSGMVVGLSFHRPDWLGGYDAFPRRMVRLGHIAFFGLGLINILFSLSAPAHSAAAEWSSRLLLVGAVTMPLTCFLTAWRPWFRHAFVIPAGSTAGGIAALLIALT